MAVKFRTKSFVCIIFLIFCISILSFYILKHAGEDFTLELKNTPQNAFAYLNPTTEDNFLIPPAQQKLLSQLYLQHYFSPWGNKLTMPWLGAAVVTPSDVKQTELNYVRDFLAAPGWGENRLHNSKQWLQKIAANMNLSAFPNYQQKAITVDNAGMRVLPTDDPSYDNWGKAGEGYPFDYLQEAYVPANTPALILQTTYNKAWDLILIHNDLGWVRAEHLAVVENQFIKEWKTGSYVALIRDHVTIEDSEHHFHFLGRIGAIYPLTKTGLAATDYQIKIAVADRNDHAVISQTTINSHDVAIFPLAATSKNIATVANRLLGEDYGWGGMNGYRDCSETLADLFTPFGIWLPRNSAEQADTGVFTPLNQLSAAKKQQFIIATGIPFLTLLKLPGHIVLYIGEHDGTAYIFHNFWGVHTRNIFGYPGRAMVGKTSITPLTLGQGYLNVPKSFLDLVQGMTILGMATHQ
jgi:cell wall-associated NlpC family hydrolase